MTLKELWKVLEPNDRVCIIDDYEGDIPFRGPSGRLGTVGHEDLLNMTVDSVMMNRRYMHLEIYVTKQEEAE